MLEQEIAATDKLMVYIIQTPITLHIVRADMSLTPQCEGIVGYIVISGISYIILPIVTNANGNYQPTLQFDAISC